MSSYLARLKQLESEKNYQHAPDALPTKPSKPPFVGFDGTETGHIEKNNIDLNALVETMASPSVDDMAIVSRWWLVHYRDREPVKVICSSPGATRAEMLAWRPDAIAAEPFEPITRQPNVSLTAKQEATIRAWLAHIEETDVDIIAEVLNQCQLDVEALLIIIQTKKESNHANY